MFTIGEIACIFGMKESTIRYWLLKNRKDYECDFYDFNISDLLHKIKSKHSIITKYNNTRRYFKYIILDIDEFKYELFKYIDFIKSIRQKKRAGKDSWTLTAIDCYNCNMNCSICSYKKICERTIDENREEPPMKTVVKKLLSSIGKPPQPYFLD